MRYYVLFRENIDYDINISEIVGIVDNEETAKYFKANFGLKCKEADSEYLENIFKEKLKCYDVRILIKDKTQYTIYADYPLHLTSQLFSEKIYLRFPKPCSFTMGSNKDAYGFEVLAHNEKEALEIVYKNYEKLVIIKNHDTRRL